MPTTAEKAAAFVALHQRAQAFIIPNPWDVGSARLLEQLGFEALATSSAGHAFSLGQRDNSLTREQVLAHCRALCQATSIPVSADLESGFGDDPKTVAETIRLAAETGLAGGSIEDYTGRSEDPIYPLELAVERIKAAVEAARALPHRFTLTARCENYVWGRPDLPDTIRRLQAYQEAGADVLYAPNLRSRADIVSILSSIDRPLNAVMGPKGLRLSLDELSALGVRRVSVGSSLARAAYGALLRAGREMQAKGTFNYAEEAVPFGDISAMFTD